MYMHVSKDPITSQTSYACTVPKVQFDNGVKLPNHIYVCTTELIAINIAIYAYRRTHNNKLLLLYPIHLASPVLYNIK